MFELQQDETVGGGARRIALEQLDGALRSLRVGADRNEAIHDARKRCKKLRAVLRLVRDGLPGDAYRLQNAALRDAARQLSAVRDDWVLVETVAALQERHGALLAPDAFGAPLEALRARHRAALERALDVERVDEQAVGVLERQRAAVEEWRLDGERELEVVVAGVRRVYRRGRRALARAAERPTSEAFHDWRKAVKYLWYQARLLRVVADGGFPASADRLERLARRLGEEHDLAVLAGALEAEPGLAGGAGRLELLHGLVAGPRRDLRRSSLVEGRRIFERKPSDVKRRLEKRWGFPRGGAVVYAPAADAVEEEASAATLRSASRGGKVARFDSGRRRQG
jgi:CHAD domain-containing protein